MTSHNNTKIYGAACYTNLIFNGLPYPIQDFLMFLNYVGTVGICDQPFHYNFVANYSAGV